MVTQYCHFYSFFLSYNNENFIILTTSRVFPQFPFDLLKYTTWNFRAHILVIKNKIGN